MHKRTAMKMLSAAAALPLIDQQISERAHQHEEGSDDEEPYANRRPLHSHRLPSAETAGT